MCHHLIACLVSRYLHVPSLTVAGRPTLGLFSVILVYQVLLRLLNESIDPAVQARGCHPRTRLWFPRHARQRRGNMVRAAQYDIRANQDHESPKGSTSHTHLEFGHHSLRLNLHDMQFVSSRNVRCGTLVYLTAIEAQPEESWAMDQTILAS